MCTLCVHLCKLREVHDDICHDQDCVQGAEGVDCLLSVLEDSKKVIHCAVASKLKELLQCK